MGSHHLPRTSAPCRACLLNPSPLQAHCPISAQTPPVTAWASAEASDLVSLLLSFSLCPSVSFTNWFIPTGAASVAF